MAAATALAVRPGIGLALAAGRPWSRPGAILDADFAGGRYAFAGRNYPGKAAFLAAIGGSESSGKISIGPYVAPGAPELISNGDFSGGTTGWTTTQAGLGPATGAVVGGELVVASNGANSPFAGQGVAVLAGRAYRALGKVRGAGGSFGPNFWITPNANGTGFLGSVGAINTTTSLVESICTFATVGAATTMYVGARAIFNPASGSFGLDDYSCRECMPFAGFTPMALSGVIAATTPAAASGNQILWQTDDGAIDLPSGLPTERNYIRLYWDASRHLHLLVSAQATAGSTTAQADLDLGVVAVSTPFRVAFSAAPNSFIASRDGQPAISDTSGTFPGAAQMRIGRGQGSANDWAGTVSRITIYAATKAAAELEHLSGTAGW